MTRGFAIGIIAVAVAAGAMLQAQSSRDTDVQLKAAQQKAEVEGDLKGAIEAYKKVVANAGANRLFGLDAHSVGRLVPELIRSPQVQQDQEWNERGV